jgi:hypothetical protein
MRRRRGAVAVMAALMLTAAAWVVWGAQAPSRTARAAQGPTHGSEVRARNFDPRNFDDSANVDNEWLPLKPGSRYVLKGSTRERRRRIAHRVVFTVTDLTKTVAGVRAVVGWDRDFSAGEVVEAELIFLAQDNGGNVWHLGQYSETYEDGELVGGRVFFAGIHGAKAGIMMKAEPRLGTPAYSEGFAPPPFFWGDRAKVFKVGRRTCVPVGCYDDVLVIDEFDSFEPGAHQLKYYARGVGNVRVGFRGRDAEGERLVLARVSQLGRRRMAQVRRQALQLERRALTYGLMPRSEPR